MTMQIYKTFSTSTQTDTPAVVKWGGSLTEAAKHRKEIKESGFKAETATMDIPTAKSGLLAWLNKQRKPRRAGL